MMGDTFPDRPLRIPTCCPPSRTVLPSRCRLTLLLYLLLLLISPFSCLSTSAFAFDPSPSPPVLYTYDLRYTSNFSLPLAYDEQHFVSALAGLANRHRPALLLLLQPTDDVWLTRLTSPGQWLSNSTLIPLLSLSSLLSLFPPLGVCLYPPAIPSTSLLAATIAGSDSLLPVAYRPSDPASLYHRLVASGPRLPIGLSLAPLFNASSPSPKSDAYAWLFRRQLSPHAPLSDPSHLGYFPDAYCASHEPHLSDPSALQKLTAVNGDWVVAQGGLFFDLAPWDDEAPIDDPTQPLGADVATLLTLLALARNATSSMVHIAGFTPWWCKYVAPFSVKGHEGVAAEWATARLTSSFDAFLDADACCIATFPSASLYQHHPLPERFVQRPPPTRDALIARGLLSQAGQVTPGLYYLLYSGDYDSAAWLYAELLPRWEDGARGQVPIAWPVDPELALRFPPIFPLLYATATAADVLVAGDSGAGYINPTQLYGPARVHAGGAGDGRTKWRRWNEAWYRQMGVTVTGFIISGDAPQMNDTDLLQYFPYSPNGAVVQGWPGVEEHLAGGKLPVAGQTDLPGNATQAAAVIAGYLPGGKGPQARFWMFRSVLTSPGYLKEVAEEAARGTGGKAVAVDALTWGYLMRAAWGAGNDDRVAYVGDTAPAQAGAGTVVRFGVTVRNDGWNVLAAGNHSLLVTVAEVQWMEAVVPRPTRRGEGEWERTAAGRLGPRLENRRWPANPALARQWKQWMGLKEVAGTADGWGERWVVDLPGDVQVAGEVEVMVKVKMPSKGELRRRCGGCFGSARMREEVAAIAVLEYEVAERVNGSWVGLSEKGNLPWRTVIWLQ